MRISKEQIKQAAQVDLAEYLINKGEELQRNGTRYRHKTHDSLVFTKNAYFWNSKNEHGNAIDFMMSFYGMDFKTAISELTRSNTQILTENQEQKTFSINNAVLKPDMRRAIAYLCKTRSISYNLITELIKDKLLFQEEESNNIVFPIYDENNVVVGAETCGTLTDKRYKGIKENSKYGYGYNIRYGEHFKYALFFESAVELISFIDLKIKQKRSIENSILVSMAGLKTNVVEHTLKTYTTEKCFVCTNNDEASSNFQKKLVDRGIKFKTYLPEPKYKDWNDQLCTDNYKTELE